MDLSLLDFRPGLAFKDSLWDVLGLPCPPKSSVVLLVGGLIWQMHLQVEFGLGWSSSSGCPWWVRRGLWGASAG
jgi:hypothetical protein